MPKHEHLDTRNPLLHRSSEALVTTDRHVATRQFFGQVQSLGKAAGSTLESPRGSVSVPCVVPRGLACALCRLVHRHSLFISRQRSGVCVQFFT